MLAVSRCRFASISDSRLATDQSHALTVKEKRLPADEGRSPPYRSGLCEEGSDHGLLHRRDAATFDGATRSVGRLVGRRRARRLRSFLRPLRLATLQDSAGGEMSARPLQVEIAGARCSPSRAENFAENFERARREHTSILIFFFDRQTRMGQQTHTLAPRPRANHRERHERQRQSDPGFEASSDS